MGKHYEPSCCILLAIFYHQYNSKESTVHLFYTWALFDYPNQINEVHINTSDVSSLELLSNNHYRKQAASCYLIILSISQDKT
jgi:hypothetical protein